MAIATSKRHRRTASSTVESKTKRPGNGTTTVRISAATHQTLRQIADESRDHLQTVLDKAVEHYRRKLIFDAAEETYAALRADPEAWAEELAERRLWENTLMDGLEDEPPYPLTDEDKAAIEVWRAALAAEGQR